MTATPAVGHTLEPLRIDSVSAEAMKAMAVVLSDPNPIHLDPGVVRRLGLGDRVINQGPSGCGYMMNMLLRQFPGARLRTFQVRFLANVFGGDSVVAAGQVREVEEQDGRLSIGCDIWLDVDGGHRAIQGTATVTLPR